MKAKLCGLPGGGKDKSYEGEGEIVVFGGGKHLLYFSGVEVCG